MSDPNDVLTMLRAAAGAAISTGLARLHPDALAGLEVVLGEGATLEVRISIEPLAATIVLIKPDGGAGVLVALAPLDERVN